MLIAVALAGVLAGGALGPEKDTCTVPAPGTTPSTPAASGATIVNEPQTTDYGEGYWADRSYQAKDPEGHNWWFAQRISG